MNNFLKDLSTIIVSAQRIQKCREEVEFYMSLYKNCSSVHSEKMSAAVDALSRRCEERYRKNVGEIKSLEDFCLRQKEEFLRRNGLHSDFDISSENSILYENDDDDECAEFCALLGV